MPFSVVRVLSPSLSAASSTPPTSPLVLRSFTRKTGGSASSCNYDVMRKPIRRHRFHLLRSMLPRFVVCLSATFMLCIVVKRQTLSTRFLLHTPVLCLSQIVLKFGLHRSTPSQILLQNDPPPVDLSVGDIGQQMAAEWLQIAQWSQRRAYRKPPSLFRMVSSLTPYDLSFPQNGVSNTPIRAMSPFCGIEMG